MSIRPVGFLSQNSKTLIIKFNKNIKSVNKENFAIRALDDSGEVLSVESITIDKSVIYISTDFQKPSKYYSLIISDDPDSVISINGDVITENKLARTVFFVGFERYNPVRDNMLAELPKIVLSENSMIKDILSEQAESIYRSRKSAGQILSDNYIRQSVEDERRVRSSTSLDRLSNENAFGVSRISRFRSSDGDRFRRIIFDSDQEKRLQSIDSAVSLQQEVVSETVLVRDIKENKISLSKNIIKLLGLKSLGEESVSYDFENRKYSIFENKYDQNFALKNFSIKENELLVEKSFIDLFSGNDDTIEVRYLTKNREINPTTDATFFQVINVYRESLSERSNSISLKNSNICDDNGDTPSLGEISFIDPYTGDFSEYFTSQISAKGVAPSKKGEYFVDYETGEVFVYGESGKGLEVPVFVSYKYKRILKEDYDYYVYKNDLSINHNRVSVNDFGTITFSYEKVFEEGYHYRANLHKEVMPENVGTNLTSSFSLRVKNYPITNVFRIINKTTQEIYGIVDYSGNEIFFSGGQAPRILANRESANFKSVSREKLTYGEAFISSISKIYVSDRGANYFDIGNTISSDIIDSNSTYFVSDGVNNFEISNIEVSNGIISRFNFSGSAPTFESNMFFGMKSVKISLENKLIMSKNNENVGSSLGSSLKFTSSSFTKEKPFASKNISKDKIRGSSTINQRFLCKDGNYIVDYVNGDIYCSVNSYDKDFGYASYSYSEVDTTFGNALSKNKIYSSTEEFFFEEKSDDGFIVKDFHASIDFFEESEYVNIDEQNYPLELKSDFTVPLFRSADKILGLYKHDDFFGKGDLSDGVNFEKEKDDIESFNFASKISKVGNILDFKKSSLKVFKLDSDFLKFDLDDYNFGEFFSLKLGEKVVNSDLIYPKESIFMSGYVKGQGLTTIYVSQSDVFSSLNASNDLVRVGSSTYNIVSASAINKSIVIDGEVDVENPEIVQQCYIENYEFKVHSSSGIDTSQQYPMTFVPSGIPEVGTTFAVHFSSGKISIDYNYLADNIQVFYEYGDNEIEWLDSSFSTGEEYFVSYEYGALRSALKVNFGLLTGIPFFERFGLNTDREIYRDALEASLKSFQMGPTKESISSMVESLSKTVPDIKESVFEGWILGRDILSKSEIESQGSMLWGPVKYKSGLLFNENSLSLRSKNILSPEEGTISFWCRNQWGKISNDSDIEIKIPEFERFSYYLPTDKNIFDIVGPVQNSGVEIKDFISIEKSDSGVIYSMKNISPLDSTDFKFKLSHLLRTKFVSSEKIFSVSVSDGYKIMNLEFSGFISSAISFVDIKKDIITPSLLIEYYKSYFFSGDKQSLSINEKIAKIKLSSSQDYSGFNYVSNADGYIFKIIYQQGDILHVKMAPENWDGYKYDQDIESIDLSSLKLFSLSYAPVLSGSDSISEFGQRSFTGSLIDVSINRKDNSFYIGKSKFYYSDLPNDNSKSFLIKSLSDDSFKIERLLFNNNPHFNEDFVFIGKDKKKPSAVPFSMSANDTSFGVPNINAPGVYFFLQDNDVYDLDSRVDKYWVCDIEKSMMIDVPSHISNGETVTRSIPFSFNATINGTAESDLYLVEESGSVIIEEKNYELDGISSIKMIEDIPLDLSNVNFLKAKTESYEVSLSEGVTVSGGRYVADNSSDGDIKFSFPLPKFLGNTNLLLEMSIENIDQDFSQFFKNIGGYSILGSLFEIKNERLYAKAMISHNREIVIIDSSGSVLGVISTDVSDFAISIEYHDDLNIAYIGNEIRKIAVPLEDDKYGERFISFLITDSKNMQGGYSSYYPETRFLLEYISIDTKTRHQETINEDFDFHSSGKNFIIKYIETPIDDYGYQGEGYGYGYGQYGYGYDGYHPAYSRNRIYFVADRPKYYLSTDNDAISLFRGSDGFLKFKIKTKSSSVSLSSDITNISADSVNHIAASWKSDPVNGSRIHMFINGKEVPNIIRFNQGFSSPSLWGSESKEIIQNEYQNFLDYGSNISVSFVPSTNSIDFGQNNFSLGDVFIVSQESDYLPGVAFICGTSNGTECEIYDIENLEKIEINASGTSNIKMAPSSKIRNDLMTSKLSFYIDDQEVGIKIIDSFSMSNISSDESHLVKAICDQRTGKAYFVKKEELLSSPSVSKTNTVYVKTHGIFVENISQKYYSKQDSQKQYSYGSYYETVSSFKTNLPRPIFPKKVKIKKIIKERFCPQFSSSLLGSGYYMSSGSEIISVKSSTERDRGIVLRVESDNMLSDSRISITVTGESSGSSISETISLQPYDSEKLANKFSYISSISFSCETIDGSYEPLVISIEESEYLSEDDGVFVFDYKNGEFLFSSSEVSYVSENVTPGIYQFFYKSKLFIDNDKNIEEIFIGSNSERKFNAKSFIEEFRISDNLSEEIRPNSFFKQNAYDISKEYLSPVPLCASNGVNLILDLNNPFDRQITRLKTKKFYDEYSKSSYKFSENQISSLSESMSNEPDFVEKMLNMGFSLEESNQTYIEVHRHDNSPVRDLSRHYPEGNKYRYKTYAGPTEDFEGSGIIKSKLEIVNDSRIIPSQQFNISFWFSTAFDSVNFEKDATFFEARSIVKKTILSSDSNKVVLSEEASEIIKVNLSEKEDSVYIDDKTGRFSGGSGVYKEYAVRSLNDDNKTIILKDSLPSKKFSVDVFYIRKNISDDKIRIFLDKNSNMCFEFLSGGSSVVKKISVNISENSWNKVMLDFKEGVLKGIINGKEAFRESGVPSISRSPSSICVGSRYDGSEMSETRISNVKISRRSFVFDQDFQGKSIDKSFSKIIPSVKDEYTSLMLNFDSENIRSESFAQIIDPERGIFSFEIDVFDNYNFIRDNNLEDLLEKLITKSKPAHTKSIIRYVKTRC